jgi:proteasome lid subunit RPN8/RPN11
VENEAHFSGGVNFDHLQRVKIGRTSSPRTAEFQFVFRQSALNRVKVHGDSSPRAEICGVLVGEVYRDEYGPFALVEHIIEGQASTGSAGQVTFTADTWQHIQVQMDRQYPDLRIVGWYHTHPGHGIFLSEMDVFLHESFFGLPWQCALVYDPRSGDAGVFTASRKKAEQLDFLIEYDEAAPAQQPRSAVSRPESPLDAAPESPQIPAPAPRTKRMPRTYPRLRRFGQLFGRFFLAIIGLMLFTCMGGLLGLLIRLQHIELPYWIARMWTNG